MEAEDRHVCQRPDRSSVARRAERMRSVRDDRQRPAGRPLGDRPEGSVIGRLARVVDRYDGPRPGLIDAATAPGSMSKVPGTTSANRASAPAYRTAFAVATNVSGDVIASSPGRRPAAWSRRAGPRSRRRRRSRGGRRSPGERGFERRDARSGRQPVGTECARDRGDVTSSMTLTGVRQDVSVPACRRRWRGGPRGAAASDAGMSSGHRSAIHSRFAPVRRRGTSVAPSRASRAPGSRRSAGSRSRSGDGCARRG